jgi:hypothetical protein
MCRYTGDPLSPVLSRYWDAPGELGGHSPPASRFTHASTSPSNVTLAPLEYLVNVTLTPIYVPTSPWLLATSPSRLGWAPQRDGVGESRGEAGGQALASGSRDAARRPHGDARLRRRLDEVGSVTGLRFSLGLWPSLTPTGGPDCSAPVGARVSPCSYVAHNWPVIPGLVCPGP